jgi:hypothetical protein
MMANLWAFLQHFAMMVHAHPGFWLGMLSLMLIRVTRATG